MEARKLKGAQIVKTGGVRKRSEHLWLVPSQSHNGGGKLAFFEWCAARDRLAFLEGRGEEAEAERVEIRRTLATNTDSTETDL